jgi:ELWxxDGT repeat protein
MPKSLTAEPAVRRKECNVKTSDWLVHARVVTVLALVLTAVAASAGTPVRLTDVQGTGTLASGARLFVRAGDWVYFRAEDADHGWELWRTNGKPEDTRRVTDVVPGPNPPQANLSQWFPLAAIDETVYFHGWDAAHGWELWTTDGTATGTALVKDLTPGPGGSNPQLMAATSDRVFFSAGVGNSGSELYITDGSEAETELVKRGLYNPVRMVTINERAFILNAANGRYIWWVSDGTETGTGPFEGVAGAEPWSMRGEATAFADGFAYFTSCNTVQGCEVWRSDGTPSGTSRFTDLVAPSASYQPTVQVAGVTTKTLFVVVWPQGPTYGNGSFWAVDLTIGAATKLGDYQVYLRDSFALGDVLYFRGPHLSEIGWEPWRSDGTPAGTFPLDLEPGPNSSNAYPIGSAANTLYLRGLAVNGVDGVRPNELWASDGTVSGSTRLLQLVPSELEPGGNFGGAVDLKGQFVFGANELSGRTGMEPWISDGTPAGTRQIRDVNAEPRGADPGPVVALGDAAFAFSGCDLDHGCELWKSDGTPGGTALAANLASGWSSSYPLDLTAFNGSVYFRCQYGYRLCRYDGVGVEEITIGQYSPQPYYLTVAGGSLYFSAMGDNTGRELWRVGSSGSPALVKDVYPGTYSANPYNLMPVGDALYFVAYSNLLGEVIWKTDGTEAGTTPMKTAASDYWNPYSMAPIGSDMFFRAGNQDFGAELWRTDGTAAGTALFKDINTGFGTQYPGYPDSSSPYHLTAAGDRLFFTAFTSTTGRELWTSDGTVDGTHLVKDIVDETPYHATYDGVSSLQFSVMSAVEDDLYFTTWEPGTGVELWHSDATEDGTAVVRDIASQADAFPADLLPYRGTLLFTAWDPAHGRELWQTDGTADGTVVVAEFAEGSGSSSPTELSLVRGQLFLSASDGVNGRELWRMALPDVVLPAGTVPEGGSATLIAMASDPDGTGLSFDWDLDDDGAWDPGISGSSVAFSAIGLDGPSAVQASVRVTDAAGVMAIDRAIIAISNVAPVVTAGGDEFLEPAGTLTRTGRFADPGPDTWTATVDYGDGSGVVPLPLTGMSFSLEHTYMVPGAHTVTVVVTDDDGAPGSDSFMVDVGTSEDWIDDLIDEVGDLLDDGTVNKGQANSLTGKLQKALDALQAGDVKKAITMLEAFINEVEAFIRGGVLTHEEGDPLLAKARAVLASLT